VTVRGRYTQTVTLFNVSSAPITGPFALVLDNLTHRLAFRHHHLVLQPTHFRLLNANGFTSRQAPLGSPFVFDAFGSQQLSSFEGAMFVLQFRDPLNRPIVYSPRLIVGELP
jgi:hypothetical protein